MRTDRLTRQLRALIELNEHGTATIAEVGRAVHAHEENGEEGICLGCHREGERVVTALEEAGICKRDGSIVRFLPAPQLPRDGVATKGRAA